MSEISKIAMKELITITEQNGKRAVSARELHKFLEATERFSYWFDRQRQYGLIEGIDYVGCKQFNALANQTLDDYALTIDCAKEISMLQRSDKGKQARLYFIEIERKYRTQLALPQTFADALRALAEQVEETEKQKQIISEQAPKVLFTEAIIGSKSSCLIGELAKIITQNGYYIGQNRLFSWMRINGYLGTRGERYNIPNQRYIEQGLFELKKGTRSGDDGVMHTTITTKVTGKGQGYFVNKFLKGITA